VLFDLTVLLLISTGFAFWIWMIIDCATNEPSTGNDKIVWIVVIVFTHIIGALIYYFVRRRPRRFAEWQRRWQIEQQRQP
jgi:prolipoprotein diacylglyceryltransferase